MKITEALICQLKDLVKSGRISDGIAIFLKQKMKSPVFMFDRIYGIDFAEIVLILKS